MSNFMDGIKSTLNNECNVSVTENGAVSLRTSTRQGSPGSQFRCGISP